MTSILDLARTAFRPYETDGLPASGAHEPLKSDVVNVFSAIYAALAGIGVSAAVTVSKATKSDLDGDLAHAAGVLAIVHSDGTAANNGIYKKSGGSGSGSWSQVFTLDASASAAVSALESRTITAAGLATGGGDLSANRTITVTAASSAEVVTGSETGKAVTPSALTGAVAAGQRVGQKGSDIASSSSIDLGAATGDYVDVTGTTTITALGTVAAGIQRTVRFSAALTLTHNATSLILPGGASITTAAGDVATFRSLGSGNWRCVSYQRANGMPLAVASDAEALAGTATDKTMTPAGVKAAADLGQIIEAITGASFAILSGNPGVSGAAHVVVNEAGQIVTAVTAAPSWSQGDMEQIGYGLAVSTEFSWAHASPTGEVQAGVRQSGLLQAQHRAASALAYISGTSPRTLRAKAMGSSGIVDLLVSVPGHDIESTSPPPDMTGNTVTYYNATTSEIDAELLSIPKLPAGITTVYLIPSYGQSNASYFDGSPVQTTAPDHTRSLMPNAGQILGNASRGLYLDDIATLVPAWGRTPYGVGTLLGESILPGVGYAFASRMPSSAAVVTASFAIGGAGISSLGSATTAYRNMIRYVQRLKIMCALAGVTLKVPGIVWVQGEADAGTSASTYQTAYEAIQTAADTAIKAITGQSETVVLLANPVSSWTQSALTTSAAQLVPAAKAIADATKFVAAAPLYYSAFSAQLHDNGPSRRHRGEQTGHALADYWLGSLTRPFCYATSAVRSGASVQLTFPRAVAFDTSVVSDPGNAGIRFFQTGGNSVSVSSVALNADPTKIDVNLSDTPTGTAQTIGIADLGTSGAALGRSTGPRSTIREATSHQTAKNGDALYRYVLPHQIPVT